MIYLKLRPTQCGPLRSESLRLWRHRFLKLIRLEVELFSTWLGGGGEEGLAGSYVAYTQSYSPTLS